MKDQFRTPLRSVLLNFLNHIEKLESSSCPESSYDAEFQNLKLFSETVKAQKEYACTEGEKETNRKKNRYKDILPFDISRVILNEYVGILGSDYINANYIKGASGSPAYIASQGPLPCTVNDFWRMVVQCEVQVIVMACNEEEAGKAKCEKYWVDEGEEKQFGMISVKLLKSSTVCPDFSVRTMKLTYTNSQNIVEERTVCQLHYVAWPDHGVPTVVQPLLEMVRLVRDTQASETLPVLVHCSAGCGRTGTICAIDYVWGLLRTGKLTEDFSLLGLIREMRRQRISMVQTKEQYILVHEAVRELFKEQLLMIDSHPYENVDPEGLLIIKDEENHYDTVETISNTNYDEKKDSTMEKDVAPPLPQKKHNVYSSKQEKDVVNLSAQQRSITLSAKKQYSSTIAAPIPKVSSSNEIVQSTAQILRKKLPNPIPSKGILRVPHLKNMNSTPVKRSKSLKLMNSGLKQNISVSPDLPIETKRRGSLESTMGETASTDDVASSHTPVDDFVSSKDRRLYDSPIIATNPLRKYSIINHLEEKRPLVRSLTTFDMRQKHVASSTPLNDISLVSPLNVKCKLSRSNTQVDFSRLLTGRTANARYGPNIDGPLKSSVHPMRKNNAHDTTPLSIFTSQRNENKPTFTERPLRYNFNDPSEDVKPSQYEVLQKDEYKWNPLLRREAPFIDVTPSKDRLPICGDGRVHKTVHTDPTQKPCSSNSRNYQTNVPVYRYAQKNERFPTDEKTPPLVDTYSSPLRRQGINGPVFKEPAHSKHASRPSHAPVINSRANKYPHLPVPPVVSPLRIEPRGCKHLGRFDIRNQQSVPSNECRGVQPKKFESTVPLLLNDRPGNVASTSKSVAAPISFIDKDGIRRNPFDPSNSKTMMKSGCLSYNNGEESKGIKHNVDKILYDVATNQCKVSNSPTDKAWRPNSSPNHQFNPQEVNKPEDNNDIVRRSFHGECLVVPTAGYSQGQPLMRQDSKESDYFSNAPGVDIDQVAASIPQKDMNKSKLMKVALEAFSIRRSRQQARLPDSSPSSSSSSKGSSTSSSSACGKKKQQQYL